MSVVNQLNTMNGFFKETYADKLKDLIPDGVKLVNKIPFMAKNKMPGNKYHQPVILGQEHGITYAASDDDAFNLNAPVAGVIKDAEIRGNPMVLRSQLGYTAISRAAIGDKASFESATKYLVANMLRSLAKKLEIALLYGQMGIGTVSSVSGAVITITTAEWAPGIWAGANNMQLEIRNAAGTTLRGYCAVTAVSMVNRTITVNALPSGTTGTDVIWEKGAYGNQMVGIHKVLSTSSGTLFNIDVSTYQLFSGNAFDAGSAQLTFNKIQLAISRAVEKGLDGSLYATVSTRAWGNLMNEQAALRMYDSSYSIEKAQNGSKAIKFYSQNGDVEIDPSIFIKEGYAFMLHLEDWSRVGSSDMTFKLPGAGENEFFRQLENSAGVELRLWTDQAVFCSAPGKSVYISGIVNASS